MAASGTKYWFLEEWTEDHIKEIQQYGISKKEEQNFCHTVYGHVKEGSPTGYLHRKIERLKIKDALENRLTEAAESSIRFFIKNNGEFPDNDWVNFNNVKNMLVKSGADRLFEGEDKQHYLDAIYAILNSILDQETILKIKNGGKIEGSLLKEIFEDEDAIANDVILAVSEVMSAHLCFRHKFPDNWFDFNELNSETSANSILDGRLYQPGVFHCWIVNLSWMMAHLHKCNDFIIFSDVSPENLIRKTRGHEGEFSGFAREITLAKKMGYHIEIEEGTIFMRAKPEVKEKCQNLNFSDVFMTDDEIEQIYLEIQTEIDRIGNRTHFSVLPSQEVQSTESNAISKKRERSDKSSIGSSRYPFHPPPKNKRKIEEEQGEIESNTDIPHKKI